MKPVPELSSGSAIQETRLGVRVRSAESALQRESRAESAEFEAALLMASLPDRPSAVPEPSKATDLSRESHQSESKGRGERADQGAKPTSEAATTALSRSQADLLRTVGRGVSLSELAKAQLEGKGSSEVPGVEEKGGRGERSVLKDAPESESLVKRGDGREAPSDRSKGSNEARAPSTDAPGTLRASTSPVSASVAALDRLASASGRVQAIVTGRGPVQGAQGVTRVAAGAVGASHGSEGGRTGGGVLGGSGSGARGATHHSTIGGSAASGSGVQAQRHGPSPSRGLAHPASGRHNEGVEQRVVASQVHRALSQALASRDGTTTLRLSPEHLGPLRVEISREESGMAGKFEVVTPEARRLLESSMSELRAALEARGVRVDRLEVYLTETPDSSKAGTGQRPDPTVPDGEPSWATQDQSGGGRSNEQRSATGGGARPEERNGDSATRAAEPARAAASWPAEPEPRSGLLELVA